MLSTLPLGRKWWRACALNAFYYLSTLLGGFFTLPTDHSSVEVVMEMCVFALCNLVPIMEGEHWGNTGDTPEIIYCDHGTVRDELKY